MYGEAIACETYLRNKIFFKLERNRSLPGTGKPRHPNCTSTKSSNRADCLSPFRSRHMMHLRRYVSRCCLRLRSNTFLFLFRLIFSPFYLILSRPIDALYLFHCNNFTFYCLTSFGESKISRTDRAKIPIFFDDALRLLLFIYLFA